MENPKSLETTIIGNCLACQGLVRVPSKAPATSKVRCPHCTKSFLLSQILDQSIPELELIDGSSSSANVSNNDLLVDSNGASKDDEGRFVVAPQLRSGSKRPHRKTGEEKQKKGSSNSRSTRRSSSSQRSPSSQQSPSSLASSEETEKIDVGDTASHDMSEDDLASEFAVSERERPSGRSRPSPNRERGRSSERSSSRSSERSGGSPNRRTEYESRRKSRSSNSYESNSNPAVEAFKVIIGGVLAIPIAYLLVLWVFGQDPLQVGPTIGKTVPFAVPAKFRNDVEDGNLNSDTGEKVDDTGSGLSSKAGANTKDDSSDSNVLDVSGLALPTLDPTKVGKN